MAIDFMTGAASFALINLLLFLFVTYMVYRIGKKFWKFTKDDSSEKTINVLPEVSILAVVGTIMIFFGSVTQPKLSLNPLDNRDLIEYQSQSEDISIETPPPRTETLKGFTPLKD